MTKTTIWIIGTIIVIFGLFAWSAHLQKADPDTIATRGIHWHPQVHIFIDDEELTIPENIGLEYGHEPIHTHDDANEGIVHLEFEGGVKQDDVRLKEFFNTWSKDINDFGTLVNMTVNGEASTKYGEYLMQDEDVIKLYYNSAQEHGEE